MTDTNTTPPLSPWKTPVGQDCIALDTALCGWLGARLAFLGVYSTAAPLNYANDEVWQRDLTTHSAALLAYVNERDDDLTPETYAAAQAAFRWVADHLGVLWD
jgi:hypothetical protein